MGRSFENCGHCRLGGLCVPEGLDAQTLAQLDSILNKKQRAIEKGETIFHSQQKFDHLFAVRTGSFKSHIVSCGQEQIVGFHFAGELLGFKAVHSGHYMTTAVALETSSVCEIAFDGIVELSEKIPALQRQLLNLASQNLATEFVTPINSSSEQRLALFLLSLSARFKRQGFSEQTFFLSMPRGDIANYLGLAIETVSRVLSKMQQQKLLQLKRREVVLLDMKKLQSMVYGM